MNETKTIVLKKVNSPDPPQEFAVTRGVTAGELLAQLGYANRGYVLKGTGAADVFGMDEEVFGRVVDGQVLHVSADMQAGLAA